MKSQISRRGVWDYQMDPESSNVSLQEERTQAHREEGSVMTETESRPQGWLGAARAGRARQGLPQPLGQHRPVTLISEKEQIPDFGTHHTCSSDGKASACNAGDLGSIPGSGRSHGEGNSNPLQYPCLENSMDRGAWQALIHGVTKSQTRLGETHLWHLFVVAPRSWQSGPWLHTSPSPGPCSNSCPLSR